MRFAPILLLFLLTFFGGSAVGQTTGKPATDSFPEPQGYVTDLDHRFTATQRDSLEVLLRAYEKQTTTQIAVVTLHPADTSTTAFDQYSFELAQRWVVGNREKNNGILIAIAVPMRYVRVHNGLGIDNRLSDQQTLSFLQTAFFPQARKQLYYEATRDLILALIEHLGKEPF